MICFEIKKFFLKLLADIADRVVILTCYILLLCDYKYYVH